MDATAPRRAAVRERPGARAAAALAVSALANALALGALHAAGALQPANVRRASPVVLARVSAAEWEARRRVAAEAGAAASPRALDQRAVPAAPPEPPRGTIVSVAPSPDPRRPERARFLAERDNSVARETQWRGPVDPAEPLAARPTSGAEGAQGIPLPGEEGEADVSEPGREGTAEADAETRIARARRALAEGARPDPGRGSGSRAGEGGARRAGRFDPRVLPVGEAFQAAGRGSPSARRLPGVAEGDATLVNTRAFRFAAFYRRVYDAIQGEWRPNEEWDERDPHERRFGTGSRWVHVDVVLDGEGRLREARIARGSGLAFLDRECLRAIAAAAPFPNPPRGLAGPDGLVSFPVPLWFDWDGDTALDRLLPRR
jgi:TonB family protein